MPQPVTGYLSAQGKFFSTIQEANLYECRYALQQATTGAVKEMLNSMGQFDAAELLQTTVDDTINFINDNEELIFSYIEARRAIAVAEEKRIELDRQPTLFDKKDDPSIRHDPDSDVGAHVSTETATAQLGNEN